MSLLNILLGIGARAVAPPPPPPPPPTGTLLVLYNGAYVTYGGDQVVYTAS